MKKILFIVLLCSAYSAFAQNNGNDTVRKYGIRNYFIPLPKFPLILLNDREYDGNLIDLNINIKYIKIFSGPGASAIYGSRAANGVILLGDKRKQPKFFYSPPTDTLFAGSVIYMRDGILTEKNNGDKNGILRMDVVKGDVLKNIYNRKLDSIVIITTRDFAIKSYKRKFSGYSESYTLYLESHKNNDKNVSYIIDGVSIQNKEKDDVIWRLYNIPYVSFENIRKPKYIVEFIEGKKDDGALFITTNRTN